MRREDYLKELRSVSTGKMQSEKPEDEKTALYVLANILVPFRLAIKHTGADFLYQVKNNKITNESFISNCYEEAFCKLKEEINIALKQKIAKEIFTDSIDAAKAMRAIENNDYYGFLDCCGRIKDAKENDSKDRFIEKYIRTNREESDKDSLSLHDYATFDYVVDRLLFQFSLWDEGFKDNVEKWIHNNIPDKDSIRTIFYNFQDDHEKKRDAPSVFYRLMSSHVSHYLDIHIINGTMTGEAQNYPYEDLINSIRTGTISNQEDEIIDDVLSKMTILKNEEKYKLFQAIYIYIWYNISRDIRSQWEKYKTLYAYLDEDERTIIEEIYKKEYKTISANLTYIGITLREEDLFNPNIFRIIPSLVVSNDETPYEVNGLGFGNNAILREIVEKSYEEGFFGCETDKDIESQKEFLKEFFAKNGTVRYTLTHKITCNYDNTSLRKYVIELTKKIKPQAKYAVKNGYSEFEKIFKTFQNNILKDITPGALKVISNNKSTKGDHGSNEAENKLNILFPRG